MKNLSDQVAIITGASRGIGRGIALELARHGAIIIVNYHKSSAAANDVVMAIESLGGKATTLQANVSKLSEAEKLINSAVDHYGKLDILVNNAGVAHPGLIMTMKEDDWDTVIETNLKSAWNCSKFAIKAMIRKRYGRIINITSVAGIVGQAGNMNYSTSKAGLIGLTKSLAKEVGKREITVNAIAPGFVSTDMTANYPEDILAEINKRILLQRWGTVEDVAHTAAFLASSEASYITGQILAVDGGLSIN